MPITFVTSLAIIFNHIINIQYFPDAWKFGVITAIPKPKKDNTIITNYRPITQLSSISKILEKKMDMQIRKHCETNNILNKDQYGFQPNKSTEMAAAKFITDIIVGLNEKKPTIALLLDFQAAFDTLWHKAIIYKMHMNKFDRYLINLVKSYLSDRSFVVKLINVLSSQRIVKAGAPQGGILSAIFFLLYINDFPKATKSQSQIKKTMFADDTIIYTTTDKIKQAQKDLNSYLQKIYNYVLCWKLKLNAQKTEQISIVGQYKDLSRGTRKQAKNIKLKINNITIKTCDKVKYLGIMISSNFKFIDHVKYVTNKLNITRAQLYTAFNNKFLDNNVKKLMYKQLIRPIILYACACWMQISSNQMEKIRQIERWYLRKITGLYKNTQTKKFINSKILYEKTQIERIDQTMMKNNLKFINKIKNNNNEHIRDITKFDENYINANKYKPLNYYHHMNDKNTLIQDKKLLIFNRGQRNPNQTLYVTNQNEMNI